jgi:PAS domain S-box-containing protein
LEKESIRKKVDLLDIFFWIKNRYGFCDLVNQKLADYFDSSFAQLEGNHEEIFFSLEDHRIKKSFNDIAIETKKAVSVEGLTFIDKEKEQKFSLINIPIIDEEDSVIAIVSVSITPNREKKFEKEEKYSIEGEVLNYVSNPIAIINTGGNIIKVNRQMSILLDSSIQNLENKSINKVFNTPFVQKLDEFLQSKNSEIEFESSKMLIRNSDLFLFTLGKIFDREGHIISVSLSIKTQKTKPLTEESNISIYMIENLIKNNPDAVLICDKDNLKFIEVNDAALSLYGYRKDEFLQLDLSDLYFAEDIQLLLESSRTHLKDGTIHGPYKHKKKDGTAILVEMSGYSIQYKDRLAYFHLVKSISSKIETEKLSQSFKFAFEKSSDLIFITDSVGFIKYVNESVTRELGLTENELINSSFISLILDDERSKVGRILTNYESNKSIPSEFNLKTSAEKPITIVLTAIPVFDFNKKIDSFTLIGKLKSSQAANSLESDKTQVVVESNQLKSKSEIDARFLSDLFHELLTPINVILGFAQDITDSVTQPSEEQKEASLIIKENRANLLQTMNTAIEYASMSEEDFKPSVEDARITEFVELLSKDAEEIKNSLDVEFAYGKISSSLKFETDRHKFKYFLSLLYGITVRTSDQKKIYFSAYPKDKDFFIISIRDFQSFSSKRLVVNLKNIFTGEENLFTRESTLSRISINLARRLLKILKGRLIILRAENDKFDYGIVFPNKFGTPESEESKLVHASLEKPKTEETETQTVIKPKEEREEKVILDPKLQIKESESIPPIQSLQDIKSKFDQAKELNEKLQNELRLEALRARIRKKEAEMKPPNPEEDSDEAYEDELKDELIEETIEFLDFDLQDNSAEQIYDEEGEFEVVEISSPKEKSRGDKVPQVNKTDEKVDLSNFRCLYIEDQIDSQILFSVQMKGLKDLNFAVSFEQCLPLLNANEYDFIVIDINLQGSYNGLDIMRIIRTMPKYENTPIIAVTAYMLPGDQHKFVLAGFNGFISKPIFRDQMIDVLAEVFNEPKQS